jgi:hypothetical protein
MIPYWTYIIILLLTDGCYSVTPPCQIVPGVYGVRGKPFHKIYGSHVVRNFRLGAADIRASLVLQLTRTRTHQLRAAAPLRSATSIQFFLNALAIFPAARVDATVEITPLTLCV